MIVCLTYVGRLDLEGLFLVNGNAERVDWLRQRYDSGEGVELEEEGDLASAVSLLRLFLQELPEPLITMEIQTHLLHLHQGTVSLSVYLSVYLYLSFMLLPVSTCLSVSTSVYLSVCLYLCLPVCLYLSLSTYRSFSTCSCLLHMSCLVSYNIVMSIYVSHYHLYLIYNPTLL